MSLKLTWATPADYDRVALTRMRCYSPATGKYERYKAGITADARNEPGDFILASRDSIDIGTATSLSLHIWMRGGRIPCQGVAYVGTIKTHRRGGTDAQRGVASQIMDALLLKARERQQPITALMPFRASFYEHFGYGNAEQRVEWTVPLSILPRGEFPGFRFFENADRPALLQTRLREASAGQCDIESSPAAMSFWIDNYWSEGVVAVDQAAPSDPISSYCFITEDRGPQTATAVIDDWSADSPAALVRMLHFLASLKDQYTFARITLPAHLPLNRLLKETQIPHRQVDHPVASSRPYTRMQIRILDHKAALEAMTLPPTLNGKITVAVGECEGTLSCFQVEADAGKLSVKPFAGHADVQLSDVLWASIVSGDITATTALTLGKITTTSPQAVAFLDAFSVGSAPFCQEYF